MGRLTSWFWEQESIGIMLAAVFFIILMIGLIVGLIVGTIMWIW